MLAAGCRSIAVAAQVGHHQQAHRRIFLARTATLGTWLMEAEFELDLGNHGGAPAGR
ncbi:MAG: hypothetical protein U1F52_15320 [Burkholderiales bacterium]